MTVYVFLLVFVTSHPGRTCFCFGVAVCVSQSTRDRRCFLGFWFLVSVSHATHGLICFCLCFSNPPSWPHVRVFCILCFRSSNHSWPQVLLFLFLEPALLVACACVFVFCFCFSNHSWPQVLLFLFLEPTLLAACSCVFGYITRPPDRMCFRVYFCSSSNFSALFSRRPAMCWSYRNGGKKLVREKYARMANEPDAYFPARR